MAPGWSGPSPILILVLCVYPEAALMTVGNLTYPIVMCMELHGEDYHLTAGGDERRQKMLGGQMLRKGGLSQLNST